MDARPANTYMAIILLLILSLGSAQASYPPEHERILKLIQEDETLEPEAYPLETKESYLKEFEARARKILSTERRSEISPKDEEEFLLLGTILEALEFEEGKVDRRTDEVESYLKNLEAKVFGTTARVFIDYINWQRELDLRTPGQTEKLIVTNRGLCAGGSYGYENAHYSLFVDGCYFQGNGNVSAKENTTTYHEGRVAVQGFKFSLGGGIFISSVKAEIGFKIPLFYSTQDLASPPSPGPRVQEDSKLKGLATLYSRWPFGRYFVQTEYGKFLDQDSTLFSLGFGFQI